MRYVALILVCAAAAEAPAAEKKGSAHRVRQPQALRLDPAAVNRASESRPLVEGDRNETVLRAQILLSRARFSCGEIDAHYGSNLAKAVVAFRQERNLASAPGIDDAVWKALETDTAPALIQYTIAPDDVAGPFVKIPAGLMKQAELPALGWRSPLEALAEKFHSSPAVVRALNPGKKFETAGEQIRVPNVLLMPPGPAARVEVSKSETAVRAYDEAGKLIAWYAASAGSEHDPLPIGEWKILGVARNPVFHYNAKLFWDARNPDEKAKIAPGPNNPVGVVWIDLSKEHYGLHGTPEPSRVGHTQSHGCIRLTNWDAAELATIVKPNTPAILRE